MFKTRIGVTLDEKTLHRLDVYARKTAASSRSQAIREALMVTLERQERSRLKRARLERECAKADPKYEHALAEEGLAQDALEWPEYRGARFAGPRSIRSLGVSRRAHAPYSSLVTRRSIRVPAP